MQQIPSLSAKAAEERLQDNNPQLYQVEQTENIIDNVHEPPSYQSVSTEMPTSRTVKGYSSSPNLASPSIANEISPGGPSIYYSEPKEQEQQPAQGNDKQDTTTSTGWPITTFGNRPDGPSIYYTESQKLGQEQETKYTTEKQSTRPFTTQPLTTYSNLPEGPSIYYTESNELEQEQQTEQITEKPTTAVTTTRPLTTSYPEQPVDVQSASTEIYTRHPTEEQQNPMTVAEPFTNRLYPQDLDVSQAEGSKPAAGNPPVAEVPIATLPKSSTSVYGNEQQSVTQKGPDEQYENEAAAQPQTANQPTQKILASKQQTSLMQTQVSGKLTLGVSPTKGNQDQNLYVQSFPANRENEDQEPIRPTQGSYNPTQGTLSAAGNQHQDTSNLPIQNSNEPIESFPSSQENQEQESSPQTPGTTIPTSDVSAADSSQEQASLSKTEHGDKTTEKITTNTQPPTTTLHKQDENDALAQAKESNQPAQNVSVAEVNQQQVSLQQAQGDSMLTIGASSTQEDKGQDVSVSETQNNNGPTQSILASQVNQDQEIMSQAQGTNKPILGMSATYNNNEGGSVLETEKSNEPTVKITTISQPPTTTLYKPYLNGNDQEQVANVPAKVQAVTQQANQESMLNQANTLSPVSELMITRTPYKQGVSSAALNKLQDSSTVGPSQEVTQKSTVEAPFVTEPVITLSSAPMPSKPQDITSNNQDAKLPEISERLHETVGSPLAPPTSSPIGSPETSDIDDKAVADINSDSSPENSSSVSPTSSASAAAASQDTSEVNQDIMSMNENSNSAEQASTESENQVNLAPTQVPSKTVLSVSTTTANSKSASTSKPMTKSLLTTLVKGPSLLNTLPNDELATDDVSNLNQGTNIPSTEPISTELYTSDTINSIPLTDTTPHLIQENDNAKWSESNFHNELESHDPYLYDNSVKEQRDVIPTQGLPFRESNIDERDSIPNEYFMEEETRFPTQDSLVSLLLHPDDSRLNEDSVFAELRSKVIDDEEI